MFQLGSGESSTVDLGLPTSNITQSGLVYQHQGLYKVFFNPSVPFVYLNNDDWKVMENTFKDRY